jgi:hypothetical protein
MTERTDFWARRKASVQAEEEAETRAIAQRALEAESAALAEKDDAEILAELNLPDPDALEPGDDIRGFMAKAVPDRLRRRALRQLWRLNPVLANVDGLVDYGEDFTDAATVVENLQTAYQVGKGMLAHVEEMARQAELADADPQSTEMETAEPLTVEDMLEEPIEAETPDGPTVSLVAREEPDQSDPDDTVAAPRRMRFAFEG